MSKQLAISSAFSIFAMAAYALLGTDAVRVPLGSDSASLASPVEISAPVLPDASTLLPSVR